MLEHPLFKKAMRGWRRYDAVIGPYLDPLGVIVWVVFIAILVWVR